jgi:hypothetical protein
MALMPVNCWKKGICGQQRKEVGLTHSCGYNILPYAFRHTPVDTATLWRRPTDYGEAMSAKNRTRMVMMSCGRYWRLSRVLYGLPATSFAACVACREQRHTTAEPTGHC